MQQYIALGVLEPYFLSRLVVRFCDSLAKLNLMNMVTNHGLHHNSDVSGQCERVHCIDMCQISSGGQVVVCLEVFGTICS